MTRSAQTTTSQASTMDLSKGPEFNRATSMLLDLSTYGALVVMGTLGVSSLDGAWRRAAAIVLCLCFAGLHAVAWARPRTAGIRRLILGCQTLIVAVLVLLPSTDYVIFGFLLYVLSVHVALLFSWREAAAWITGFWLLAGVMAVVHRGTEGFFEIVFAAAVFPLCGVLGYALRELARSKAEGEETLEQLRAAQHRIEELAVTGERNRLARDLHDSVKQQLFAATMQLGAARGLLDSDPSGARRAIDEADTAAQKAAGELNLVIHALRPPELTELGLGDALRAQARQWARQSGVPAEVDVRDERPLPAPAEESVLRVASEALANAARHSRASRVQVALDYLPTAIRLRVTDDGSGFDPRLASDGVGLESMRARIRALGGVLNVRSELGAGTVIEAILEMDDG